VYRGFAQREDVGDDLAAQGEGGFVDVGVQKHDLQPGPGGGQMRQHPGHRGDADARAGEHHGATRVVEDDVAVGQ
jgi:hypothetical protein